MKISQKEKLIGNYCILHDSDFFEKQKIAGQCVAACLKQAQLLIENYVGELSGKDIESACLKIISEYY